MLSIWTGLKFCRLVKSYMYYELFLSAISGTVFMSQRVVTKERSVSSMILSRLPTNPAMSQWKLPC